MGRHYAAPGTLTHAVLHALPDSIPGIAQRLDANRFSVAKAIYDAKKRGKVAEVGATRDADGYLRAVWDRVEGQP
jgi:hypothetical protein